MIETKGTQYFKQVVITWSILSRGSVQRSQAQAAVPPTATPLGMGLMGIRGDQIEQPKAVLRGGMSGYLLAFEIISVHLVVVLVGAAYLARAKRRIEPERLQLHDIEVSESEGVSAP